MDGSSQVERAQNQAAITPAELSNFFLNNFGKLDSDKDGFVTDSELNSAQKSGNYTGRDLNLLNILDDKRRTLEGLNPDENFLWRDNDGITVSDMSVLETIYMNISERMKEGIAIRDFLTTNFASLDKDQDTFISRKDLVMTAADVSIPEAGRKIATQLLSSDYYSQIMTSSNDEWGFEDNGITKKDLEKYKPAGNGKTWNPHFQEHPTCAKEFPDAAEILDVFAPKK